MNSIILTATKPYLHAWRACYQRIITAAQHEVCTIIYVSDDSLECFKAYTDLTKAIPSNWETVHIPLELPAVEAEAYKVDSQLLIAKMQQVGLDKARQLSSDFCWMVEADVLVPADSFRMLKWSLSMPTEDGSPYYDVAMVTYPNGHFLGGCGTPQHPIAEDYLAEERTLPKELLAKYTLVKKEEEELRVKKEQPTKEWIENAQKLNDEIKKCPPNGNIWQLNATNGWRRRGWLDNAYPAVGRGAILPTDWVGVGCTMLSKKALALATFEGYEGKGTQDLFLCWHKWFPAGLKMTVITHTLCDHVKHERVEGKNTGKYIHHQAYHEQQGENRGHLRVRSTPWVNI